MAEKSRELSGLTVKIDVDVSETIRGLKAVQREAKRATQALAELSATNPDSLVFTAGENVRWDFETSSGLFQCICADKRTAVFAPTWANGDGGFHVEYRDMFAVSNDKTIVDVIRGKYEKVAAN